MDQDGSWRRDERRSMLFQGGRIFMVLAGGGGLLICWGVLATTVLVYPSDESQSSARSFHPLSGSNLTVPLIALAAGVMIVVLALLFVALRRTETRRALAAALILIGVLTGVAFSDRSGDIASLVPGELLAGLSVCDASSLGPCITVYWPTESISWGGWIAAFWGAVALARLRSGSPAPSQPEARIRVARASVKPTLPDRVDVRRLSNTRSAPSPRKRSSDVKVLAWLVGVTAAAAVFFWVGFGILYGMFAGDRAPPGPVIQNDTLETIYVFTVDQVQGTESRRMHIPSGQSREIFGNCTDEIVLRDENGRLIDRRGPFEDCDLDTWVIEGPNGGDFS